MARNFRPVKRDQPFLLPLDMREWLRSDHFAHFVIDVVNSLDTSAFVLEYRADGKGGAAYDPTMMATLLFYAYCDGERASRRIEEHCQTDIAYRYITGNNVPDHVTICRFRERFEKQIAALFVPVLAVCLKAGLGDLKLAAIDGSKLRCPASLRANRTLESIEKELARLTDEIEKELARIVGEILAEARRADLDDDTLPGMPPSPPREPGTLPAITGLPKALRGKAARRARFAAAKDILETRWAGEQAAHDAALRARAAKIRETGKGIRGRKPQPPVRDPKERVNVTDPDSRIMKNVRGGYLQGYNAQNSAARDQLSLAAEVVADENDYAQLLAMMTATDQTLTAAGSAGVPDVVTADSGYRTADVLAALDPTGPTVLMPAVKERETRRRASEPPAHPDGPPPAGLSRAEAMDWTLDTPWGKATYKQRSATVEPGFGDVKHNRRFTGFMRVGLPAADSEWKIIMMTSNLRKLFRQSLAGKAHPPLAFFDRLSPATS